MLLYTLLTFATLALTLFVVPMRAKPIVATAILGLAAIFYSALALLAVTSANTFDVLAAIKLPGYVSADFFIDPLSAVFILVVSVVAMSVGIYAAGYMRCETRNVAWSHVSLHLFSLVVLYLSIVGVLTARDGYCFLISWELMTVSSFMLMLFYGSQREVRKAALNYLVLMHICFIFLLVGFVTVSKSGLPMNFDSLGIYFASNSPVLIFVVFLLGFGMKAGVFPLHIWLSDAYTAAPPYVSAIMSGAMSKMGVYGVIRVLSYVTTDHYTIGLILLGVGIVTALWGVLLSTMQRDIKRLLSYSSIENLGIIFLAVGVATLGIAEGNKLLAICAMGGALFHVMSHSMLKSVLFFSAGNIETQAGTTNMEQLGGLAKRMPMTAIFTIIGLMAICALPPLCGFASEFLIYFGLFTSISSGAGGVITSVCALIALALVGGVAVVSFTKLYGVTFSGERRTHDHAQISEVGSLRVAAFALPVLVIIVAGVFPALFAGVLLPIVAPYVGVDNSDVYLERIMPILNQITVCAVALVAIVVVLYLLRCLLLRGRSVTQSPTWGCGFTAPSERMQYSAESFSEGLHSLVGSLSKNRVDGEVVGKDEIFPHKHSFNVGHKDRINELFSQWWVELIHKINVRVMILRTGKVNYYVLYALLFFGVIFVLTLLKLI